MPEGLNQQIPNNPILNIRILSNQHVPACRCASEPWSGRLEQDGWPWLAITNMEKHKVMVAITELSAALVKMVQEGRSEYEQSGRDINSFCKHHGSANLLVVYPVQDYARCFNSAGVKSKKELESLWSKYFSDPEIRDLVEALISAEECFKDFIKELDRDCKTYEDKVALPLVDVGSCLEKDISFVEARNGKNISLGDVLQQAARTLFILRKHYV